jgi:hypothetical protein
MTETPGLDTVTEAVEFLATRGYDTDLVLARGGVAAQRSDDVVAPEACSVDYQFRFEGESDPADENIVLGVQMRDGRKGILVSAYGKDVDPEHAAVLRALMS